MSHRPAVAAALAGVALMLLPACLGGGEEADAAPSAGGPPPALVRLAEVGPGELTESWSALGEVVALQRAELAAEVTGKVGRVGVREGELVERRTALVQLEDGLALAQESSARAAWQEAKVELERREAVLARREAAGASVLSAEELADARANVDAQAARVEVLFQAAREATILRQRHRLEAPFTGQVTRRHVDPGDWVTQGQPLLELVSLEAVEVQVSVPLGLARQLAEGLEVGLSGGTGTVAAVVLALDSSSRTSLVRLQPGPEQELLPGEAVSVTLPVSWSGVGVTVPRDALLKDPSETRVIEVVDGLAQPVVVEVIATAGDLALVASPDLTLGDQVVTRGNERVRPGQAVRVEGAREGEAP